MKSPRNISPKFRPLAKKGMDAWQSATKRRADAWDAVLTDAQRWEVYDRLGRQPWHKVAAWAAEELGLPLPSRSALYRLAARLRPLEAAHRLESALAARDEAAALVAAETDDETLISAYKTLAQDLALHGDAKTALAYTQMALALADRSVKAKELALKSAAQKTKDEQLRLAREKFEAAEKRLDAVAEVADAARGGKVDPAKVADEIDRILGRKK